MLSTSFADPETLRAHTVHNFQRVLLPGTANWSTDGLYTRRDYICSESCDLQTSHVGCQYFNNDKIPQAPFLSHSIVIFYSTFENLNNHSMIQGNIHTFRQQIIDPQVFVCYDFYRIICSQKSKKRECLEMHFAHFLSSKILIIKKAVPKKIRKKLLSFYYPRGCI